MFVHLNVDTQRFLIFANILCVTFETPYRFSISNFVQVTGEMLDNLTSWDVLRAALPVGTVSGAPKVKHRHLQVYKLHSGLLQLNFQSQLLLPDFDLTQCILYLG